MKKSKKTPQKFLAKELSSLNRPPEDCPSCGNLRKWTGAYVTFPETGMMAYTAFCKFCDETAIAKNKQKEKN